MNLYSRKQRIKVVLLAVAIVIVGVSLWYSNSIVNRIKREERQKVQVWSEAVKKRLTLLTTTRELFAGLRREERNKVNLWAKATERIQTANNDELNFLIEITSNNTTVPVIVTDGKGHVNFWRNIESDKVNNKQYMDSLLQEMKDTYPPIEVEIVPGEKQYVYYKDSRLITASEKVLNDIINSFLTETVLNSASVPVILTDSTKTKVIRFGNISENEIATPALLKGKLEEMASSNKPIPFQYSDREKAYIFYESSTIITKLRYYPYVQIVTIGLFLFIAYLIFSTFRNAEQNQVWIGLAKETAHQLGTPLSSLMAWMQIMESRGVDKETISEINKDVERLGVITDRFSKIGAQPELEEVYLEDVISEALNYLQPRVSSKVKFVLNGNNDMPTKAFINRPLFVWVIENLCKNAIDAMDGKGDITIDITNDIQTVYIDITDTGKGIPSNQHKAIFSPGFTTKKRGWGLGLSLAKRIIENYHTGRIFVKRSEINKGTTFRIVLKNKGRNK